MRGRRIGLEGVLAVEKVNSYCSINMKYTIVAVR